MAKELGMIHTLNTRHSVQDETADQLFPVDLSYLMTSQLQRMVRQGNYYKLVGIDATIAGYEAGVDTPEGGSISGELQYFNPTRGRCMAYRNAWKATRNAMNDQGINFMADKQYDFRVGLRDNSAYSPAYVFPNQATLDGTQGLTLIDGLAPNCEIFGVHNSNVTPTEVITPGSHVVIPFGTYGNTSDFRLNEASAYLGNEDLASTGWESIPFVIAWDDDEEEYALSFQWRPDPALYVAVMCGLIDVKYTNIQILASTDALIVNWAFHISGWKSIMGDPDKKKKSSRRSSRGRKKSKK